jgi:hypothetical protein
MSAWSLMNWVCSPTLVDFMMYFGAIGACGIHFPGTQMREDFGCDDSASIPVPLSRSVSSCRNWSRRCGGGSKGGRLSRSFLSHSLLHSDKRGLSPLCLLSFCCVRVVLTHITPNVL